MDTDSIRVDLCASVVNKQKSPEIFGASDLLR
ncbi:hypothetical protein SRABI27_04248 [Pedobacter sp. Bi27]|nr:hypothetical protein SRABI36_03739 [Pedobacter sp. Bi36]CAH0296852.1 hypothetical protein SRABI27_04248 [Pedobacter sp. Bi27]CAH0300036.1 hypothetical protein SRABI126_04343 [Pedobacter sp. Bi126]